MPVVMIKHLSRKIIQDTPDGLFVFGDNLTERGRGGQAKECRGEPNVIGIPTKKFPSMVESAFFTDADYPTVLPVLQDRLRTIHAHASAGGTVYIPEGIGCGLAQLPERAPKIYQYLQAAFAKLRTL